MGASSNSPAFVCGGVWVREKSAPARERHPRTRAAKRGATSWTALSSIALKDKPFTGPWVLAQPPERSAILRISGGDCRTFLNGQTTNDFRDIGPGETKMTVATTPTGRMIDMLTVVQVDEEEALVLCSGCRRKTLLNRLDMVIFPADDVRVADVTEEWQLFHLSEGHSLKETPEQGKWIEYPDYPQAKLIEGGWFAGDGHSILAPVDESTGSRAKCCSTVLSQFSGLHMTQTDAEMMRVASGRPAADREIKADYNPLEAGLWHLISFDKGCYVGQETVARLQTYDGVKQQLLGVVFQEPVSLGTNIYDVEGTAKACGQISSACVFADGSTRALAYIRRKSTAGRVGARCVTEDGVYGSVVDIPFATRSIKSSPKSSPKASPRPTE